MLLRNDSGVTLLELLIVIAIIGIIAALTVPEIGRFRSNYNLRSCATELIQNMRVARAMAIKENREYLIVFNTANQRYLIGFDGNGDNNLVTLNNDTFGICNDTDGNRLPNNDADANGDSVPDCVRVINLNNCGNNIIFGYGSGTTPPNGPPISAATSTPATISASGIDFSGTPEYVEFTSNGSVDNASPPDFVYFQQTTRGYSYAVRLSSTVGSTDMFKWDGDKDNTEETNWTEIR